MRAIRTSLTHMRRTPYQTLAAILTLFITLLMVGIFSITTIGSVIILRFFESKPQLTVFFTDDTTKEQIDIVSQTLQSTGKVTSVHYVSKDEALELYREQNKSDPLLLEMVTAEILPASLEILPLRPEFLPELESLVTKSDGIEEIVYQRDVVDKLLGWTRAVRLILGGLSVVLTINAILIIMTVTTMKIALKREEIDILRLVGASRWYIRSPFIVEGSIYGMVAALLAGGTIVSGILGFRTALLTFFGAIPQIAVLLSEPGSLSTITVIVAFLGTMITTGLVLGAFGSYIAVNRFFKG